MLGRAEPNIPSPKLEIWSAGPNGIAENGTNDDSRLGTGGTNAAGAFESSPGIGLSRPLMAGERIYAIDRQNDMVGPVVPVQVAAPVPLLSRWGLLLAAAALLTLGLWSVWRATRAGA